MAAISDTDAEASILGLIATEPDRFLSRSIGAGLRPGSFSSPDNGLIFEVVRDLVRDELTPDAVTVAAKLDGKGKLDSCGGLGSIISRFISSTPSGLFQQHLDIVLDKAALREAIKHAERLTTDAVAGDAVATLKTAQDASESLTRAFARKGKSKSGKEATREWYRRWMELREGNKEPGLSTGLTDLDEVTGGLKPRELWIIGGQTSKGKSVLAVQMAAEAVKAGKRVAVFSLELGADEIVGRLISCIGRIEFGKITNPARFFAKDEEMSRRDIQTITTTTETIITSPIEIIDEAGMSLDTIEAAAAQLHDIQPVDLVVVDYLQLVRGRRGRNDSREQEVASVSQGFKQLAKKLNCPVIALSQLNDDGKLRESRAIGQDADCVALISPEGIKFLKNRNGPIPADPVPAYLNGLFQRFDEYRP